MLSRHWSRKFFRLATINITTACHIPRPVRRVAPDTYRPTYTRRCQGDSHEARVKWCFQSLQSATWLIISVERPWSGPSTQQLVEQTTLPASTTVSMAYACLLASKRALVSGERHWRNVTGIDGAPRIRSSSFRGTREQETSDSDRSMNSSSVCHLCLIPANNSAAIKAIRIVLTLVSDAPSADKPIPID